MRSHPCVLLVSYSTNQLPYLKHTQEYLCCQSFFQKSALHTDFTITNAQPLRLQSRPTMQPPGSSAFIKRKSAIVVIF